MVYILIFFAILLAAELIYFRIADKCDIIDKPNERSSHSTIVLRGGGVIFTVSMLAWAVMMAARGGVLVPYVPFLCGLVLVAGVSFWDDVHSLPDSVRLVAQFVAMGLMFWSVGILHWDLWWFVIIALIVCVGATNIINFMDGINGITAGYALSVLVPLLLLNGMPDQVAHDALRQARSPGGFIAPSYLVVAIIGVLVFCIFNFRPKGKAKCFAGDVGSIGIAFIMLFAIGKVVVQTGDPTYLVFLWCTAWMGC